jgi:hypothetical protein
MRRADNERRIFEEHETPRDLLHAGMRVMMDTGAPWCMGKGDDE